MLVFHAIFYSNLSVAYRVEQVKDEFAISPAMKYPMELIGWWALQPLFRGILVSPGMQKSRSKLLRWETSTS